ncbi:MAG: response regulator transcription factor [Reichenbachiella sp.]
MRAVLIDDDSNVRENMRALLGIYAKHIDIVAEADGVKSGISCIKEHQPDIVFLDVEMTDGTGFDLLSLYGPPDFKVIFATGHDAFAIKAFKFSAIDYLLKPVDPDELVNAVKKAETALDKQEEQLKISSLVDNQNKDLSEQKILLKDAETVYLVSIQEIVRCESEANYTRFFLSDERMIMVSKTLKEYDSLFQGQGFFRAHQSHLINLVHFDRFEKKEGGIVHMKDGSILPVAVRKKDALMKALKEL